MNTNSPPSCCFCANQNKAGAIFDAAANEPKSVINVVLRIYDCLELKLPAHAKYLCKDCQTAAECCVSFLQQVKSAQEKLNLQEAQNLLSNQAFDTDDITSSSTMISAAKNSYKCCKCLLAFEFKSSLDFHLATHATKPKTFQCDKCGKSFAHHHHLKQHLQAHAGIKPFACQHCSKAFGTLSNLKMHMRIHSGIRPFQCNTCQQSFIHKFHLLRHAKLHSEAQQMPSKTATASLLKVKHLAEATTPPIPKTSSQVQEQPNSKILSKSNSNTAISVAANCSTLAARFKFQCNDCLKYFNHKSALTKHLRTHTKEKPYQCSLCPKAFADPSNFKKHKLLHKQATIELQNVSTKFAGGLFREQLKQLAQPNEHSCYVENRQVAAKTNDDYGQCIIEDIIDN